MNNELIINKLKGILATSEKKVFNEALVYIINKETLDEVLLLEAGIRALALEKESPSSRNKKRVDPFFHIAKIINPTYPAFKYSFYLAHKPKEIFDPVKVKDNLAGEINRAENIERTLIEEVILKSNPPLSQEEANRMRKEFNDKIDRDRQYVEEVLEDFENYSVVITNYARKKFYPAIYYTLDTSADYTGDDEEIKRKHYKKKDTHLRIQVPNILWYKDDRPFSSLRANDKISRIVQTHTQYCGTIYIKKKER